MKVNYKIAAALIGSFALGVGAATVLHAQAKPPAYLLAEVDVKDQDGFHKSFLSKVQADMKEFGAKYLGGGYNQAIGLRGTPPDNRVVLLQFTDMDALKKFYQKAKAPETDASKYTGSWRVIAIPGVEQK